MLPQINLRVAAILVAIIILLSLFSKLFAILFLLIGVVIVSFIVNHFNLRILGLELATFATVITGIVYGAVIGAIVGVILVTIHLVLSGYFGRYYIWVIPEYGLAGYLASQWASQNIITLGMSITLLLHGINIFFSFLFRRHMLPSYLVYAATNVVFNFFFFSLFGQFAINVLS